MSITPPYLKKGDAVGIVCPARKITPAELVPALDVLKSWGLVPILGESIGAVYHQFGGSDAVRRADMQMMLNHSGFKAIIAARGGYGTRAHCGWAGLAGFCQATQMAGGL
jgi:muramoyltetrapeptide carboxypeptidase